jgi:hypothetical protein
VLTCDKADPLLQVQPNDPQHSPSHGLAEVDFTLSTLYVHGLTALSPKIASGNNTSAVNATISLSETPTQPVSHHVSLNPIAAAAVNNELSATTAPNVALSSLEAVLQQAMQGECCVHL